MEFDPEQHELDVQRYWLEITADRYEQAAKLEAFDRFIDLALDGVITMDDAIKGFKEEYIE